MSRRLFPQAGELVRLARLSRPPNAHPKLRASAASPFILARLRLTAPDFGPRHFSSNKTPSDEEKQSKKQLPTPNSSGSQEQPGNKANESESGNQRPASPRPASSEASSSGGEKQVKTQRKKRQSSSDTSGLEKKSLDNKQLEASGGQNAAPPNRGEPSSPLPPLPPGWVHLTEAEQTLIKSMYTKRPQFERDYFERGMKNVGITGAPVEVRNIFSKYTKHAFDEGGELSFKDHCAFIIHCRKMGERSHDLGLWGQDAGKHDMFDKNDLPSEKDGKQQKPGQEQKSTQQEKSSQQNKSSNEKPDDKKSPTSMETFTNLLGVALVLLGVEWLLGGSQFSQKEITWQEMRKSFLDKGLVQKLVVVNRSYVRIELHPSAAQATTDSELDASKSYYFSIGSVESFEKKLDEAQEELRIPASERIPVSYETQSSMFGALVMTFGPTLLLIGLIYWSQKSMMGRSGSGGVFNFGKSKAKKFNSENAVKVRFADVAGLDEAKVEIMEFVSFLKQPGKFEKLGAKIPRGAILSGPPGTGKTLLAKATAGESGVPFFSVSGSEFVEMFVGVGSSRVRDLFAQGRRNAPCIIFIDEIDAVGRTRVESGRGFGGNDEREATLNQILTEMDGFNTKEQVVVLAGTNRADVLDKALMRPGRFDRHIYIDLPTMKGRQEIFQVYLNKVVTKEDHQYLIGRLATLTPGFSGADISNVVNEAALIAARADANDIKMTHFEQAVERVIGGLERKSLVLKPLEKKTVAYHEAGHAICGWFLQYADPLLKVSIIPRGQGALGYAQYAPQDTHLMDMNQLMDRMAMTLGGRVSEELHFPTVTTGASDDFKKVTHLARSMVTEWGMSAKVGPIHFDNNPNRWQRPFAEATAQDIDHEVSRIVSEAYRRCKDLLTTRKKEVGLIAEELLKKEVLVRDDLVRILGKRPFSDNEDFEKYFGGDNGQSPPPPPPDNDTKRADNKDQSPPPPPANGKPETPPAPGPAYKRLGQDGDGQDTGLR